VIIALPSEENAMLIKEFRSFVLVTRTVV